MNNQIVNYIKYHPVRTQRGLEILTGLVPWGIILFPFAGSFFIPEVVAYLVIAFNVYWLYRSLQMAVNAISGYLNIKATQKINWQQRLNDEAHLSEKYQKIVHAIIIPNVQEPIAALERNIRSLVRQNFPLKNLVVVLAMEDRAKETDEEKAKLMVKKYGRYFLKIITTWHPLAAGETIGKHSNNTYAARQIKHLLVDDGGADIKKVLVTTCDVDTVFPPQYFSLLTYKFLTSTKPDRQFFQAPLFMYNNIGRLPFLVRVPAIISGIGFLATLQKASGRFMNYSVYSTSLSLLDKVGYWDIDVIPEDWHINLKSFFALGGDTGITPLFLPVYLDAPESTSKWRTYQSTYQTEKRWAWGVVDVPYVVKKFFQHPEISFWKKLKKLSLTLEWHFTWSSFWFWITLGATIPTVLNPAFARTALGYNLPRISSFILTICLVGILTIIAIDILLDPHRKNKVAAFLHPLTYLQWLFLPVFGFLFGSLPGLESQTRLMLGKYLEYKVTEKV